MRYPKIYLAIDNCFASSALRIRPTGAGDPRPGAYLREASADNECFHEHGRGITGLVGRRGFAPGMKPTASWWPSVLRPRHLRHAGPAHHPPNRRGQVPQQMVKHGRTRGRGGAGAGLFLPCLFSDDRVQDPAQVPEFEDTLQKNRRRGRVRQGGKTWAYWACGADVYPHRCPWTVAGSEKLLREVYRRGGAPFYLTVDVGHMNGQRRYTRPDDEKILEMHRRFRAGDPVPELWLGPEKAVKLFEQSDALPLAEINAIMDEYPHMFAPYEMAIPTGGLPRWAGYFAHHPPAAGDRHLVPPLGVHPGKQRPRHCGTARCSPPSWPLTTAQPARACAHAAGSVPDAGNFYRNRGQKPRRARGHPARATATGGSTSRRTA